MTGLARLAAWRRREGLLVCISAEYTEPQGEADDADVKPETPILQVIKITFNTLVNRRVASPSIYLRPARNANLQAMACIVMRNLFQELIDKVGALWARSHNAHVTF